MAAEGEEEKEISSELVVEEEGTEILSTRRKRCIV